MFYKKKIERGKKWQDLEREQAAEGAALKKQPDDTAVKAAALH
jgi:hypothetical protein